MLKRMLLIAFFIAIISTMPVFADYCADFNTSDGTTLENFGWTKHGYSAENCTFDATINDDMMKFDLVGTTTSTYYQLNLGSQVMQGEFTVEFCAKFSNSTWKQFKLFDKDFECATDIVASTHDGMPDIRLYGDSTVISTYEIDDDVDSPDFTSGWKTFWVTVNMQEGTYSITVDSLSEVYNGKITSDFDGLKFIHIIIQNPNQSTRNVMYMKYFNIYEGKGKNIPDYSENYCKADGTTLESFGWTKFGNSTDNYTFNAMVSDNMMKFDLDGTTTSTYYQLHLGNMELEDEFTIEMTMKISNSAWKQFQLFDGSDWTQALNITTDIHDGKLDIRNILQKPSQLIGYYDIDDDVDNPDFASGWKTFWVTINMNDRTYTITLDTQSNVYQGTIPLDFDGPKWFRIGLQNPVSEETRNIMYMKTFKVYNGTGKNMPSEYCVFANMESGEVHQQQPIILDATIGTSIYYTTAVGKTPDIPSKDSFLDTSGVMITENNTYISAVAIDYLGVASEVKTFGPYSLKPEPEPIVYDMPYSVYYSEAEKLAQRRAGKQLLDDIMSATEATYTIPKGHYRFTESNPFLIENIKDFKIVGEDVYFWIEGKINGIELRNCTNVSVQGITVDYDELPFSQGEIVYINYDDKTFDVEIDKGYKVPDASWNGSNDLRAIYYEADGLREIPGTYTDLAFIVEHLTDNRVRMKLSTNSLFEENLDVNIGDKFVFICHRDGSPVYVAGGESNQLKDLDLYSAWGFGVYEVYGEGNNLYENIIFTRKPKTNRLFAGCADGFHFKGTTKGSRVVNCEVAYTADDLGNFHGSFDIVYEKVSANELLIATTSSYRGYEIGSVVSFYDIENYEPLGNAVVTGIEDVTDSEILTKIKSLSTDILNNTGVRTMKFGSINVYKVTFDDDISYVNNYAMVQCLDKAGRGIEIIDSYFHDGHVRGILVLSPDAVVEGCRFENINGPGIFIVPERYWLSGSFTEGIAIKNNIFNSTGLSPESRRKSPGAITIAATADSMQKLVSFKTLKNISVQNNTICNSGGMGIFALNTDGLTISNNVIDTVYVSGLRDDDASAYNIPGLRYAVYLNSTLNTNIVDNTFLNMPQHLISYIHNPELFDLNDTFEDETINGWTIDNNLYVEVIDNDWNGEKCLELSSIDGQISSMHKTSDINVATDYSVSFSLYIPSGGSIAFKIQNENENYISFDMSSGIMTSGWHSYEFHFYNTHNKWYAYRDKSLCAEGSFEELSGRLTLNFEIAGKEKILLDTIRIREFNNKIDVSVEDDFSIGYINKTGQYLNANFIGTSYENEKLLSAECIQRKLGLFGDVDFEQNALQKVFIWNLNLQQLHNVVSLPLK